MCVNYYRRAGQRCLLPLMPALPSETLAMPVLLGSRPDVGKTHSNHRLLFLINRFDTKHQSSFLFFFFFFFFVSTKNVIQVFLISS